MKLVRAVRRKEKAQRKVGLGGAARSRFPPPAPVAADGAPPLRNPDRLRQALSDRIFREIGEIAITVSWYQFHAVQTQQSYVAPYTNVDRDFVSSNGFLALRAGHRLIDWLRSADGDSPRTRTFLGVLPDTDFSGRPIYPEDFQTRWGGDSTALIKHLFKKHEGEIAEVRGEWMPWYGEPPSSGPMFHPQFATSEPQWVQLSAMWNGDVKSKGKRKGSQSADGDTSNRGKGSKSADGDMSNLVISFRENVPPGYDFAFRKASVVTLPALMLHLSDRFCAADLYAFYCSCRLLAIRRQHSWGSAVRRAAGVDRKATFGHWGHRR